VHCMHAHTQVRVRWRYMFVPVGVCLDASTTDELRTNEFDTQGMHYLAIATRARCGRWRRVQVRTLCTVCARTYAVCCTWRTRRSRRGSSSRRRMACTRSAFCLCCRNCFVNYKLRSVAHLPWRAFMYKAFNTFIDDLFAFVIHMPTAHRVACFRDDIVFVAYLYQRWLYPVDRARVNEFGQTFVEHDVSEHATKRNKKTK